MTSPDINLLYQKIGLEPGEDFPWVHQLKIIPWHNRNPHTFYAPTFGSHHSAVSIKFLRSLLRLSRLDRAIDQRKKSIP